jgi:hypothetical protein
MHTRSSIRFKSLDLCCHFSAEGECGAMASIKGAVNMWNRQTQGIYKSSYNRAALGDISSFTLSITWAFVALLSVRGLSSQTWQRLEHEEGSGENRNATERPSELTGSLGVSFMQV